MALHRSEAILIKALVFGATVLGGGVSTGCNCNNESSAGNRTREVRWPKRPWPNLSEWWTGVEIAWGQSCLLGAQEAGGPS